MAWWHWLPTKESIAKQMVVSEMMAKGYEAHVDRNMANIKAYGKTKDAKAFARAQTKAEAQEKAEFAAVKKNDKLKRKLESKAKAQTKVTPKARAKVTDAQKICKLKAAVNSLKYDLRLATEDAKAKEIRRLTDTLRRVRDQLQTAKAKNEEAAIQIREADAIIEMLRAGQINCQ